MNTTKNNLASIKYVIWIITLSFVLTLSGCANTKLDEGTTIPFDTVIQDSSSAYVGNTPLLSVMTNQADIIDLLSLIGGKRRISEIQFDSSQEVTILVMLGLKPNPYYDITIEKIIQNKDTINIITHFDLTGDTKKGIIPDQAVSPFHMVKISKNLIQSEYITFNMVVDNKTIISSKYFIP